MPGKRLSQKFVTRIEARLRQKYAKRPHKTKEIEAYREKALQIIENAAVEQVCKERHINEPKRIRKLQEAIAKGPSEFKKQFKDSSEAVMFLERVGEIMVENSERVDPKNVFLEEFR